MSDTAYKRLAAIFPMLSSSAEGEVLNAVRAMTRVLQTEKLHWTDVARRIADGAPPFDGAKPRKAPFDPPPRPKPPPQPEAPRRTPSAWKQDKLDVQTAHDAASDGQLDDWSVEFLESVYDQVVHQGRTLTDRQRTKLNEIMDKLDL